MQDKSDAAPEVVSTGELQVILTTIAKALDRALEPKPSNLTRVDIVIEHLEDEALRGDPVKLVHRLAYLTGQWEAIDGVPAIRDDLAQGLPIAVVEARQRLREVE